LIAMLTKNNLKKFIKNVTPPILLDAARKVRRLPLDRVVEWEYMPEGWAAQKSDRKIKGWNVNSVLEAYKNSWPEFVESLKEPLPLSGYPRTPLAKASTPDIIAHNVRMAYAYVLGLCAAKKPHISMLDWGGGFGQYYLLSKTLFPQTHIEYHCKDVPIMIEYGRELFPKNHYYEDDSCLDRKYDFVLSSSSLHYSENWASVLQALAKSSGEYLYITRIPVVLNTPTYVMVQRPYRYNYGTEYLSWCFNRQDFLEQAKLAGLELRREFLLGEEAEIKGQPEKCEFRGFLFSPALPEKT